MKTKVQVMNNDSWSTAYSSSSCSSITPDPAHDVLLKTLRRRKSSLATASTRSSEETLDQLHDENEHNMKGSLKTSSSKTIKPKKKLAVSFSDIEIRSYEIILGDNPAVAGGPPLTIDWEPFELAACSVDEYEEGKAKPPARDVISMKMTTEQRFELLARTYSMREINARTKQVTDARRQRIETRTMLYRQGNHEKMERIARGFKNIFTNKKRKEKAYLASAM